MEVFGTADDFPYAATSYRLTEHFHFWTQARAHQRRAPARAVRRDLGAARGGEGDRARRLGQGLEQPRHDQGQGGGDQAHPTADVRRQGGAHRRHPPPLGVHRCGQKGLRRQHADARSSATPISRRRSTRPSWSTSNPSKHRRCRGDRPWQRSSRSTSSAARPRRKPRRACVNRSRSRSSSTSPSASAARPARRRAWNGTTCARRSGSTSGSTTTRTT